MPPAHGEDDERTNYDSRFKSKVRCSCRASPVPAYCRTRVPIRTRSRTFTTTYRE